MSGCLRLLMICLLALAVPAQGLAAATRAFCGHSPAGGPPMLRPATVLALQAAPATPPCHADGLALAAHRHHAPAPAAEDVGAGQRPTPVTTATAQTAHALHAAPPAAADASAASGAPDAPADAPDHSPCSACAACCSVGALPAGRLTVPAAEAATTVFAAVPASASTRAAEGPLRPPRRRA